MTEEFGPEIPVAGKPTWLKDDDLVWPTWGDSAIYGAVAAVHVQGWHLVTGIRLPTDHWANDVIAKGFIPWGGGSDAPEDWDGDGEVLFSGGTIHDFQEGWLWSRIEHDDSDINIIGYRPKTEQAEEIAQSDSRPWPEGHPATPTTTIHEVPEIWAVSAVYVMAGNVRQVAIAMGRNEAEAYGLALGKMPAGSTLEGKISACTVQEFKSEPITVKAHIEYFEDHHGGLDNNQRDIVEAYIAWAVTQETPAK